MPSLTAPAAEVHAQCLKLSFLEQQYPFLSASYVLRVTSESQVSLSQLLPTALHKSASLRLAKPRGPSLCSLPSDDSHRVSCLVS